MGGLSGWAAGRGRGDTAARENRRLTGSGKSGSRRGGRPAPALTTKHLNRRCTMAICNLTQAQETDQQGTEPTRIVSPAAVMRELWYATNEGRNMSPAQHEWFEQANELGGMMMRNLQTVLIGVGCLILSDADESNSGPSGAL